MITPVAVESAVKNPDGSASLRGELLNFAASNLPDAKIDATMAVLGRLCGGRLPYVYMPLAPVDKLELVGSDGARLTEKGLNDGLDADPEFAGKCVAVVLDAEQIADLSEARLGLLEQGKVVGRSEVAVSPNMGMAYWMFAANLQLAYRKSQVRFIPIAVEDGDSAQYHFLRVSDAEYKTYTDGVARLAQQGHPTPFFGAARYAEALLEENGVTEPDEIFKLLTFVIPKQDQTIRGAVVLNASKDDLRDLSERFVYA